MDKRHAYFNSEFKTREENGKRYISGYFAVFNQETELWQGCFEKIAVGAFDNSLKNDDIRCLFNHNHDIVLGRTANKTLTLRTDAHGLYGEVEINDADSEAVNAYERVKRGDITGCSFGFDTIAEEYENRGNDWVYTETEVKLYEVSPCTFPAYPQTEVQARQKDFEQSKKRSIEQRKAELRKKLEAIKHAEKN